MRLQTFVRSCALTFTVLLGGAAGLAQAADWPEKPVHAIVGMEPGGSHDYLIRALAPFLEKDWGQSIVVENRSGADGRIGMSYLARQKPDGYTLGIATVTDVIHPALFDDIPYDILKDFQPVSLIAHAPFVLVVGPALEQVKTASDLIDYARENPGKLTYGSSGVGSPFHLGMTMVADANNVEMLHIPFRGSAPLATALLGGEVMAGVVPVGPFLKQIEAGKVRALGTLTNEPIALLPGVPTLNEALNSDNLAMTAWLGLVGPKNIPADLLTKMNADLQKVINSPEFVEQKLTPQAYVPLSGTAQDMQEQMASDRAKFADIIKQANISVN